MLRPVDTYSIVARDAGTGQLGVAVQSHWFSVGTVVPWAAAGIGAVATQAFAEPAYGPRGLTLMRGGVSAPDALARLTADDAQAGERQVAMIDAQGRVAAHTGRKCLQHAGHETGTGFSVQANMMRNDTVVPAMALAYQSAAGDLAERLVAALVAAEAEGGDIRGRQSAALLVVGAAPDPRPGHDRIVALRIEDHATPLDELQRLLRLHRAYARMTEGDDVLAKNDTAAALAHYAAAVALVPEHREMRFWHAVMLATAGQQVDAAVPILRDVFAEDDAWAELLRRLPAGGVLPADLAAALIERARSGA